MNLNNNNHRITSSIVKTSNNVKALFIGILLIAAATFLLASNTIATTAYAQSGNTVVGCADTVKVTVSNLPNQISDASTEVTLSNIGPSDDAGTSSISIPGIGSGHVKVYFHIATVKEYGATVSDIPGQTEASPATRLSEDAVCNSEPPQTGFLYIPGIGSGSLAMIKVN